MTTSTGPSASTYGFTSEYQSGGLVYLRARHYAPGTGRFLTRDTWPGEVNRPLSLNRWGYVGGNPVNRIDPSGMCWIIENGDGKWYPDSDHRCYYQKQLAGFRNQADKDNFDDVPGLSSKAEKLYELYEKMYRDKSGWWWTTHGAGGFTIWEFMASQWGLEQDWYPKTAIYTEALANAAAAWCSYKNPAGCDMKTARWHLEFLAAYSYRPFQQTYNCANDDFCDIKPYVRKPPLVDGMEHVKAIYDRPPLSAKPLLLGDLYAVGNVSLKNEIFSKMIKWGMVYDHWGSGESAFIVLTLCQARYAYSADGPKDINYRTYSCACGDGIKKP